MTWPGVRFLSFAKHFAESSHSWENVVDVPDGQGLLQLGMVVDTSEEGYLVDFFCKGQPPRLVPYGRLFTCPQYTSEIPDADQVQVLLRISSDVPFTWSAAKLLDTETFLYPDRLVEVELELAGDVVKEIVHSSQIRNVPAHEETRAVGKNHFVMGSWAVPDRYAASLSENSFLWKLVYNRNWGSIRDTVTGSVMHPRRIRNGHVEYLAVAGAAPMHPLSVESCLDDISQRIQHSLEKGLVWSGRCFTQAHVIGLPDESPSCTSVPVPSLSFLPAQLLGEIFQFLDSLARVRQRRVCTLWDYVLSMETLFPDVWVSLKPLYGCPFQWPVWGTVHAVVLSMTALVTKSTKWVIIESSDDECDTSAQYIKDLLRLIADVARYFEFPRGGKLSFLISQNSWLPDYDERLQYGVEELAALCWEIKSVCDCLLWRNCTFTDELFFPVLQVLSGRIKPASSTLQVDIWEMLDSNAPEPNLEEIFQWLDEGNHADHTTFIKYMLEEVHVPDPRLAAQSTLYQRDELIMLMGQDNWENELDIRRLSRLTLWALSDIIPWKPWY